MSELDWDFIKAQYVTSAVKPEQYPESNLPEIAFIGRSNVGKSSLINSLTRNNHLAKTSGTPGKTRTINFFAVQTKKSAEQAVYKDFLLVDLPGYGYAKASKTDKKSWSAFIKLYITSSTKLVKIYHLIDIRHSLMENDREYFSWLAGMGANVEVIFTKADKLSQREAVRSKNAICRELGIVADRILYSSVKNAGRNRLIKNIMDSFK